MSITLRALAEADLIHILNWNEGTDAEFLMQWAGKSLTYPLTYEQLLELISSSGGGRQPYAILLDCKLIGTVDLVLKENGGALVARYLIDCKYRGHGYGEAALRTLAGMAFDEMGLKRLYLAVFDFNAAALRCYEKAGFSIYERAVYENGWVALRMELTEKRWRALPSRPPAQGI